MDPFIRVFPGPNRFDVLFGCLRSKFELRVDDPVNVRVNEAVCRCGRYVTRLLLGCSRRTGRFRLRSLTRQLQSSFSIMPLS
jgi:hypothetical protein